MNEKEEEKGYKELVKEEADKITAERLKEMEDFRSARSIAAEKVDMIVYTEFEEKSSLPGASKVVVAQYLAKKYKIGVPAIYNIRNRVEKRLGIVKEAKK